MPITDKNAVPASFISRFAQDPARVIPGAPANFGRDVLPHIFSVAGRVGTVSQTYPWYDEALRDSRQNAEIMRTECGIMECLEARQRGTALLRWHVEPRESKDDRAKDLADKVTAILQETWEFLELRRNLLEALWYGRYLTSHRFGVQRIGGQWRQYIRKWSPRHGDKIVFRYDTGDGKYYDDQIGIRVAGGYRWDTDTKDYRGYDRRKIEPSSYHGMVYWLDDYERQMVALHRHLIEDGEFYDPRDLGRVNGVGIRDRIYWTWYMMQETLVNALNFIERNAHGIEIWRYPAGNPEAEAKTIEAARNRSNKAILLVPVQPGEMQDLQTVEVIEPGFAGLEALMGLITDYFAHKIKRYILGQTLTSEAEATGLGSGVADAHMATYADIVMYDARKLEETITRDIVFPLQVFNFPDSRSIKLLFRIDTESEEMGQKLEAWERAWNMGAKLPARDVLGMIGARMPDQDEEALQNPQLSQGAAAGGLLGAAGADGAQQDAGPWRPGAQKTFPPVNGTNGKSAGASLVDLMRQTDADRYAMTAAEVDEAANVAHQSPSDRQVDAGNYPKGHIRLHGIPISIETAKGRKRAGHEDWPELAAHYGYILRTEDKDGDHVDVFIGPHPESAVVFVVDQETPGGRFNEHKVLMGWFSEADAVQAYRDSYSPGWRVGPVTAMTVDQFKLWLETGDQDQRIEGQVSRYARKAARSSKGQGSLFKEEDHPRNAEGEFIEKGSVSETGAKPAATMADEPFQLRNDPTKKKGAEFESLGGRQSVLWRGLKTDMPGQLDFLEQADSREREKERELERQPKQQDTPEAAREPETSQPSQKPPADESQYLDSDELHRKMVDAYRQAGSSSRTTPSTVKNPPIGSWKIDRDFNGTYGHMIDQLRMVPVNELLLSEDDYTKAGVNPEGRGDDALRYAEWMKKLGIDNLPPVTLIETDSGKLRVADGHRRTAAAKIAGLTHIPAWVSPRMDTGKRDSEGQPIYTAMTFEGAKHGAPQAEKMREEEGKSLIQRRLAAQPKQDKPEGEPTAKLEQRRESRSASFAKLFDLNSRSQLPTISQVKAVVGEEVDKDQAAELLGSLGIDPDAAEMNALDITKGGTKPASTAVLTITARSLLNDMQQQKITSEALQAAKGARTILLESPDDRMKLLVHPSTRQKGGWQLTRITALGGQENVPWGHTEHATMEDAIRSATGALGHLKSDGNPNYRVTWTNTSGKPQPFRMPGQPVRYAERLHGGRADAMTPADFDPDELRRGIQHEMEHADDPDLAREIAMDHLAEEPRYYERLAKMERRGDSGLLEKDSMPSGNISPAKAREILQDGTVHGKPLTEKQWGMFGAAARRYSARTFGGNGHGARGMVISPLVEQPIGPDQYARKSSKPSRGQKEFSWITISGHPGEGGKHEGGTPVKIDEHGEIQSGPLAGKTLDGIDKGKAGTERDERKGNAPPDTARTPEPTMTDTERGIYESTARMLRDHGIQPPSPEDWVKNYRAVQKRIQAQSQKAAKEPKPTPQQAEAQAQPQAAAQAAKEDLPASGDEAEAELTPREAARQRQTVYDEDYEFARQSAIRNRGEDLKGSARHKVNAWRGLAAAEAEGTAEKLVTKATLEENDPHDYMTFAHQNPLGALAAHLALKKFPARPGSGRDRVDSNRDEETKKKDRAQFVEAWENLKARFSSIGRSEDDPRQLMDKMRDAVEAEIRRLRGQEPGQRYGGKDLYNNTANALIPMHKAMRPYAATKTSVASQVGLFSQWINSTYADASPDDRADRVTEHAMQVIEGTSIDKLRGVTKERGVGFNPATMYLDHASRTGGRELPVKSANQLVDMMVDKMGMRGVQWGNSVTDDERKHHAARAAEAMMDLMDVLGLEDADASLGGKLGFAIGARGKGNALAHYEPDAQIINLTRKGGVGSLAHEWGHFFDHFAADLASGACFSEQHQHTREITDEYGRKWRVPATAEPRKGGTKRELPHQDLRSAFAQWKAASAEFRRRCGIVAQGLVKQGSMSRSKADYWTSVREVFARTFERYVQRKLESAGRNNTYLAGLEEKAYKSGGLWPTDEEVELMTPAFDEIFRVYARSETRKQAAQRARYCMRLDAMLDAATQYVDGPNTMETSR